MATRPCVTADLSGRSIPALYTHGEYRGMQTGCRCASILDGQVGAGMRVGVRAGVRGWADGQAWGVQQLARTYRTHRLDRRACGRADV